MSALRTLKQSVDRIGVIGTADLLVRKAVKQQRYKIMLREVKRSKARAKLQAWPVQPQRDVTTDTEKVLSAANRMLRDENYFFTFYYRTRNTWRVWNYDPLEKLYWPPRHYTESVLHASDTPHDVKIVWEINRFKDLPTLGQAAYLTRDIRYAEETRERLYSWIEDNPFAKSINWASGLELGIRLISWSTTLMLTRAAGFHLENDEHIQRSIYQHARYLVADLSTDKVVPTNHLIGEAAGLFLTSLLWEFPVSPMYNHIARGILETEILRQTHPDGATREATSWYHQFVTHFFDLVDRAADRAAAPMSEAYKAQLTRMKSYLAALTVNGELVRYGDADDGWALWMEGNLDAWKEAIFGVSSTDPETIPQEFTVAQHVTARTPHAFLFMRAGEFGMGGAGFSSHAHDDFLSPILYLEGLPVLVDPGTCVYNGDPEGRRKYRGVEAHNGLRIGATTGAEQRMYFGWHRVRPSAHIDSSSFSAVALDVGAHYGEWPNHRRSIYVEGAFAVVTDAFEQSIREQATWFFHLHPMWKPGQSTKTEWTFTAESGVTLRIHIQGIFEAHTTEEYDFSPSYRVAMSGTMLRLTAHDPRGDYTVSFTVEPASRP